MHITCAASKELVAKRSEIFSRLTAATLTRWLVDALHGDTSTTLASSTTLATDDPSTPTRAGPRVVVIDPAQGGTPSPPFVLFDVRDAGEYDDARIESAISFPAIDLRRDRLPPELVACRHREDRAIVVYDWDERTAVEVANKLVPTGQYPNVYILSGGLCAVATSVAAAVGAIRHNNDLLEHTTARTLTRRPISPRAVEQKPVSPLAHLIVGRNPISLYKRGVEHGLPPLAASAAAALDSEDAAEILSAAFSIPSATPAAGAAETARTKASGTLASPTATARSIPPGTFTTTPRFPSPR